MNSRYWVSSGTPLDMVNHILLVYVTGEYEAIQMSPDEKEVLIKSEESKRWYTFQTLFEALDRTSSSSEVRDILKG